MVLKTFKKRYRRRYKRNYKRKYKRYNRLSRPMVPVKGKYIGPFPNSAITRMRYCGYKNLSTTAGVISGVFFRANGIFDPDAQTGGGQPLGRDEYANLYNHYTVLGSKITVEFMGKNDTTNSYMPNVCGCYLSDDVAIDATNWQGIIEQGKGSNSVIVQGSSAANGRRIVTCRFSPRKFFGIKYAVDNYDLSAAIGEDPLEQAFFYVWISGLDLSTNTMGCHIKIMVDYLVKFTEPKEIPRS